LTKEKGSGGGWRKPHNESHNLYVSPNIIRVIKSRRTRWDGHADMEQMRNAYNIVVGKPERKRPRVRPRHRCNDNIRMDGKVDTSVSGERPVVDFCKHDNEASDYIKWGEFLD
jgi:hypothetical protein